MPSSPFTLACSPPAATLLRTASASSHASLGATKGRGSDAEAMSAGCQQFNAAELADQPSPAAALLHLHCPDQDVGSLSGPRTVEEQVDPEAPETQDLKLETPVANP